MVRFGMAMAVLACMAAPLFAQESTEQLKKELQELRAEVEGLKAVNQSKEIPATNGKVDGNAMAADDNPLMTLFKGTKLSGFVDAGYQFSFNQLNSNTRIQPIAPTGTIRSSTGNNPVRIFDDRDNSFYLHEAHLQLERLASKDMIVGYHIELGAGHDPSRYDSTNSVNLQEGWLQIMAPLGDGLDIRVGKMATLAGYEVLENMNNMNYSRGMLFGIVQPFTHTGIRAAYGMGGSNHDMVTFTVGFNNGLNAGDRFADDDHGKDVELQVAIKPIKDLLVSSTFIVGGGDLGISESTRDKHYLWDLVVAYQMDKFTFALNFDQASAEGTTLTFNGIANARNSFRGIAVYTKFQATDSFAQSLRVEYFSDLHGSALGPVTLNNDSGDGARVVEFSLTSELKVAQQLILRFEIRHDDSNQHNFIRNERRARGDNTLGFEAIMPF